MFKKERKEDRNTENSSHETAYSLGLLRLVQSDLFLPDTFFIATILGKCFINQQHTLMELLSLPIKSTIVSHLLSPP